MVFSTEDNEYFRLTDEGKELTLKLLEGASPTQTGKTFAEAAIIIWALERCLKEAIEKAKEVGTHEDVTKLTTACDEAHELWKTFYEASHIVHEWPEAELD